MRLDRVHRYAVGDRVRHVDTVDSDSAAVVRELTLRVRDGVAYPTYTLWDEELQEEVEDVLDTDDLEGVR